jgi:hypothetical protein
MLRKEIAPGRPQPLLHLVFSFQTMHIEFKSISDKILFILSVLIVILIALKK